MCPFLGWRQVAGDNAIPKAAELDGNAAVTGTEIDDEVLLCEVREQLPEVLTYEAASKRGEQAAGLVPHTAAEFVRIVSIEIGPFRWIRQEHEAA